MPIQDKLPKSRITLVYRTNISGQEQEVDLPFRVLALGDFSLGTSKDRKADLEDRNLRSLDGGNMDELMKDMDMSVSFTVADKLSSDAAATMDVKLPINRMKSFHPDEIVNQVPKLKALMLMRKLLLEMQSDIDNRKELRRALYELYSKPEELDKVLKGDKLKGFETLKLPSGPVAAAPTPTPAPPTPTPTPAPPTPTPTPTPAPLK